MRIWEVEDNKAVPSDLVREQDFILRVRRLHRLGTPHLVVNLALGFVATTDEVHEPLEIIQQRLQDFALAHKGLYAEMSNGDVFLVWADGPEARGLPEAALKTAFPDANHRAKFAPPFVYALPQDYPSLRERTNHYVELSRAASVTQESPTPSQLLHSEAARGPLTAWSVDQIGKLLQDLDLSRYVHTQPVYQRDENGHWVPLFTEYLIGFDELRRTHFPKTEVGAPDHLFLALCEELDHRLLAEMTEHYDEVASQNISLNLSLSSVLNGALARFARTVPSKHHHHVLFELHRGDILQDFGSTLNAISVLRREGFRVILDGITPDILPYIDLSRFDVDYIKLNVSKERLAQLSEKTVQHALATIPREKLIFFRCDSEKALSTGFSLGVSCFQGWLIDAQTKPSG